MYIEICGGDIATVSLLEAEVPLDKCDDIIDALEAVLRDHSSYYVTRRNETKRTVCKTNIRKALNKAVKKMGEWYPVNDDWLATFYWEVGWDNVGKYHAELTYWKDDMTLAATLYEDDLEKASELLLEEYERYMSGDND